MSLVAILVPFMTANAVPVKPLVAPAAMVAPTRIRSEPSATIKASDWELSNILQSLTTQTGTNVVLLGANPKLTFYVEKQPVGQVLKMLAAMSSLQVLKLDESYVMGSETTLKTAFAKEYAEQLAAAPVVAPENITEIYLCSHIGSTEAAHLINMMFKDEKVQASAGPGALIPGAGIGDSAPSTGSGRGGQNSNNSSRNERPQTLDPDAQTLSKGRSVVLRGQREWVRKAYELLKVSDQPRPLVAISVKIHDVSNDALKDLGVNWSYSNTTLTERDSRGVNFGSFDRSNLSFTAVLKALESKNQAKLLAEPTISVLDQEKAFILIGQRVNYPVIVGLTQNNSPIYDIKEERVGIYLQVAASVSTDQQVTLNLYPQVSTIAGYLEVNGGSYPQITTREAQTTLRIKSGETIVMGGLIRDEEIQQMEKVPLFGDLPLFGELFRRRKSTKQSSQVLISITPTIIGNNP